MPRIRGIGEIDWSFPEPVSWKPKDKELPSGDQYCVLEFTLKLDLPLKPMEKGENLLYEEGNPRGDDELCDRAAWWARFGYGYFLTSGYINSPEEIEAIPTVIKELLKRLSSTPPFFSALAYCGKGVESDRPIIVKLITKTVPDPNFINWPTRYIKALAKKIENWAKKPHS